MTKETQKSPKTDKTSRPGLGQRLSGFFTGLRSELKKVIWPDKRTLKETTLTVLAISLGCAILIFVVDSLMLGFLNIVGFNRSASPAPAPVTATESAQVTELSSDATDADVTHTSVQEPSETQASAQTSDNTESTVSAQTSSNQ